MAAAVVGVIENSIAPVTAFAVPLPVVAGQSGYAGAQAHAVTMRRLALREITERQWSRVMRKEVPTRLMNGIGVALIEQARASFTFFGHLRWTPAIALGYVLSIWVHFLASQRFAGVTIA